MNPCNTYYPTPGAHSQDNPFRCGSVERSPTCGGSTIDPKHLLYYKLCSAHNSCGPTSGQAGSNSSLIMYMQYNPNSSACSSTTVAYAAYCSKGDLGRYATTILTRPKNMLCLGFNCHHISVTKARRMASPCSLMNNGPSLFHLRWHAARTDQAIALSCLEVASLSSNSNSFRTDVVFLTRLTYATLPVSAIAWRESNPSISCIGNVEHCACDAGRLLHT